MLDLARGYFRKTLFKAYRYLKHPRRLKRSALLRWFARHLLTKRVWRPTQHTFAGGMAVGLFVTMQLIPGQMPLATVLAAAFRVNIPIALMICWLSNPATFVPIGVVEKELGEWLMGLIGDPTTRWVAAIQNEKIAKGVAYVRYMYVGGLVSGGFLAFCGYLASYGIWGFMVRLRSRRMAALAGSPSSPASR